jgi:hypothetical protein
VVVGHADLFTEDFTLGTAVDELPCGEIDMQRVGPEGVRLEAGNSEREEGYSGSAFELNCAAEDTAAGGADDVDRVEDSADLAEDGFGVLRVVAGDEDKEEIGCCACEN